MPVSSLAFIGVKYSSDPSAESGFLWGENFFDALGVMAEREPTPVEVSDFYKEQNRISASSAFCPTPSADDASCEGAALTSIFAAAMP